MLEGRYRIRERLPWNGLVSVYRAESFGDSVAVAVLPMDCDTFPDLFKLIDKRHDGDVRKITPDETDAVLDTCFQCKLCEVQCPYTVRDNHEYKLDFPKLVHRHPHIFGSKEVTDAEEVALNSESVKQEEGESDASILDSVPKQMPALAYGKEIQCRVAQVGFDWEDMEGVVDKLVEEVGEIRDANSQEQKSREFGDLLFTLVNAARWQGVDPEVALREANRRFFDRFTCMEELCRQRGLNFSELSFQEQNNLWEEAKKGGKNDSQ